MKKYFKSIQRLVVFLVVGFANQLFGAAGDIKIDTKNSSDTGWISVIFAKQSNKYFGTNGSGVPVLLNGSGGGGSPGGNSGDIQYNDAGSFGGYTPGTGVVAWLQAPSGANLASALTTALPATKGGTGLTSLGTGVATWLGTPSFSNLNTALTGDSAAGLAAVNAFTGASTHTGIESFTGASVKPPSAMGALAVDVTKGWNTKTIAADSTFTFSGTPATANTFFALLVTNSDSVSHVLTIPSSFAVGIGTITSTTISASGKMLLTWQYDGSAYNLYGASPLTTGTGNYVLSAGPTLTGTIAGASLSLSSLTSGRVTFATTAGLLTDDADMTFATDTLTVTKFAGALNGTVGATTPTTGVFTTGVFGSTTSLLLGTAGSAVGNIGFRNATSGTATLAPPTGALGTYSVTLPNAASTLPIFGQQITFAGPTAARTVTYPDANFTVARSDAANTFTGTQTITQIDMGNTDTSITRSAAGVIAVEGVVIPSISSTNTLTAKTVQLDAALGTDDTTTGTTVGGLLAGATIAQWETVYVSSSSTYLLADANGSGTFPAVGVAIAAYSSTNPAIIVVRGTVRNDAWNWTPGGRIYLSGTAGGLTQTAPSASGDKVQDVGFALTANIAYLDFNGVYVTVQ